jgi:hypothetical protein
MNGEPHVSTSLASISADNDRSALRMCTTHAARPVAQGAVGVGDNTVGTTTIAAAGTT